LAQNSGVKWVRKKNRAANTLEVMILCPMGFDCQGDSGFSRGNIMQIKKDIVGCPFFNFLHQSWNKGMALILDLTKIDESDKSSRINANPQSAI
jgi:hypothetical protein